MPWYRIKLSQEQAKELAELAQREMREPRDQLHWMVQQALSDFAQRKPIPQLQNEAQR